MTQERQQILEQNDRVFRRVSGKIGLGMIFFLLIFYSLNTVAGVIELGLTETVFDETTQYCIAQGLYIVAYVLGFLIPALLLRHMLKKSKDYRPMGLRWRVPRVTPLLIVGAIALNFAAAYFNSYLVTLLLPFQSPDLSVLMEETDELYEMLLLFLSTAVVPALVEEILFRGVVMTALLPFGGTVAIFGSALLFALMHGNILQFFYTALMGVVLGYVYFRTRSIWCGVLIHFFNNALSVLQQILVDLPDADMGLRWSSLVELLVILAGMFSVFGLLMLHRKRRRPEDSGSFGVVFAPSVDYQRYPTSEKQTLKGFFTPSMIVFVILAGLTMAGTFLTLLALGA
ncbi:MAG: CPBP family intramembrane metalloprotease [Ruminococcaceae bacterium]|nr:CPBP family intramembrane metalloprotease [Oscillospiraceae bacterium]